MRRVVVVLAAVVVVVLLGGAAFAFVTIRQSFPDTTGDVTVSGLSGEVTVARDAHGIPQVYADDPEDLFFAQGYVHAQDRFYEMDFRRHVTSGRLAELVGESALETDQYVRTLGWRRVAEQELELLDPDTRSLLDAYARGVNAYVAGKSGGDLSLEYSVLSLTGPDYRPEVWTAADSVAWVKAMAWDLRSNMGDEIDRVLATERLSVSAVEELYPPDPPGHRPIVTDRPTTAAPAAPQAPDTAIREAVASLETARRGADALPALLGTGDGIGSNSWVVSGERTATGAPLLANDPHLAPSMPGIWYQVGLHCREVTRACPYDVAGFSFSGLPGVVVGHNRRVAWGVTTMYADVADLVLEKVTGDTYEHDGRQVPLETRRERFEVAGGETRTITVRSTRNGPLLSDLDDDVAAVGRGSSRGVPTGRYEVALRWTALRPEPTVAAVFALGRAQDWDDFREAARLFTVPSQNLVYADVDGTIGYQAPGTIPVRGAGDGRWPVPGWDSAYDWTGSIPFDDLPSVVDPADGYVVTANHRVTDDDRLLLGADTAAGYRAARIRELLEDDDALTVADMSRIQSDTLHPLASTLVPRLLDVSLASRYHRQGQDVLRGWDGTTPPDSAAAAYLNVVWRALLELTFHDELPDGQHPDGGERWFNVVSRLLDEPRAHWWDDITTRGRVETRDDVLAEAMRRARDELTMQQSSHPEDWTWGKLHRLELVNPTLGESGIGVVEDLFNRGPFEVGGGGGLVDATGWHAAEGYEVTAVPSMRMVVDLGGLDRSRWVNLTGASGHAFHDHYLDQAPLWRDGRTLPWAFSRRAVDAATEDTLTLRPGSSR